MLDKVNHYALLYDFYGQLLTAKQQEVFDLYYQQDWSLSEIADYYAVSRPAVHDLIKRVEKQLDNYESKLKLVAKFKLIDRELGIILSLVEDISQDHISPQLENLRQNIFQLIELTRE